MANPFNTAENEAQKFSNANQFDLATVVSTNTSENLIAVEIRNEGTDDPFPVTVPEDTTAPPIGSLVVVGYTKGDRMFLASTVQSPDESTSPSSQFSVSDDGTLVVDEPTDLNFTTNVTVTDDGDGTASIDVSAGGLSSSRTWSFPIGIDVTEYTHKVQMTGVDDLTNDGVQKTGSFSLGSTAGTSRSKYTYDPDSDDVYATDSGTIYKVNSDLATTDWSTTPTDNNQSFEVAVGSGSDVYAVFGSSTNNNKTLRAFDKSSGTESWSTVITSTDSRDAALEIDSSNNIYVQYYNGNKDVMAKFDSTGTQVASETSISVTFFTVSPNFIFVVDETTSPDTIYKYDHSLTQQSSTTSTETSVLGPVSDINDNVYLFNSGIEKLDSSLTQQFFNDRGDFPRDNPIATPDGIFVYTDPSNLKRRRAIMLDYSDGSELYSTRRFLDDGTWIPFSYAGTPSAFPSNF